MSIKQGQGPEEAIVRIQCEAAHSDQAFLLPAFVLAHLISQFQHPNYELPSYLERSENSLGHLVFKRRSSFAKALAKLSPNKKLPGIHCNVNSPISPHDAQGRKALISWEEQKSMCLGLPMAFFPFLANILLNIVTYTNITYVYTNFPLIFSDKHVFAISEKTAKTATPGSSKRNTLTSIAYPRIFKKKTPFMDLLHNSHILMIQ